VMVIWCFKAFKLVWLHKLGSSLPHTYLVCIVTHWTNLVVLVLNKFSLVAHVENML
jgi:hypothetical protein